MSSLYNFFAGNPLLLLFVVIGAGSVVGSIRIFGFSLGASAVLFTGIFFGALDPRMRIPDLVYVIGLVLFVYTVGLQSGPTFFASFGKRALRANVFIFGAILFAAIMALAAARLFHLDGAAMVGVFCGSLTNTPALAASVETMRQHLAGAPDLPARVSAPVIGYGIAYPFGVIGVLISFSIFGRLRAKEGLATANGDSGETTAMGPILARTFRVVNPGVFGKKVEAVLGEGGSHGFVLSRLRRGNNTSLVNGETVIAKDDLIVAVGEAAALERARMILGEESTADIQAENKEFDFRRVEVSDRKVVGKSLRELDLQRILDTTITRIRRGDVDFVPMADTVLERGDRVRVLTWKGNVDRVARFLGDSVRSSSEADFLSLSFGLVLGVLLGSLPLPLPSGGTFTLGFAGGPLIVGLLLGRIQHTGPISWGMPYGVNLTIRQIGLIFFLAGIGTKAGDGFLQTVQNGGLTLAAVGAVITTIVTLSTLILGSRLLRLSTPAIMGLMSGLQTQPACLAYANDQGGSDAPNVWYAAVYPASMISKIILAQLLVGWLL